MGDAAETMRLLLFVLAKDEESQLEKTVCGLQAACAPGSLAGMVLLLAPNATQGCRRVAEALQNADFRVAVEVVVQPSWDFPACVKSVLLDRQISHLLFVASDYYYESSAIADLIARAKECPGSIHRLSRTMPGGGFSSDYNAIEVLLYRLFCVFVRVLYGCRVTDPASAIAVVPERLFRLLKFRQGSLLIGAEWMFALLRSQAAPIVEIPAVTLPRAEGKGFSTVVSRLRYVPVAIRMRFIPLKNIWEEGAFRE